MTSASTSLILLLRILVVSSSDDTEAAISSIASSAAKSDGKSGKFGQASDKGWQGGTSSSGAYQQYYEQYIPGGSAQGASVDYEQYYQTYLQQIFGGVAQGADKKQTHSAHGSTTLVKDNKKGKMVATERKREELKKQAAAEKEADALAAEKKKEQEKRVAAEKAAAEKAAAAAKAAEEKAARLEKEAAEKEALVGSADFLASFPSAFLVEVNSCTTTTCVEDWRKKREANIQKYVPEDFHKAAIASIEKKCKQMLARIAAAQNATRASSPSASSSALSAVNSSELAVVPPMVLAIVSSCTTEKCVKEWHNTIEINIKKFVPKDHQYFPLAMIDKEYEKHLARVAAHRNASKPAEEISKSAEAFLAAGRRASQTSALSFASLVLLSVMIVFSVARVRARQGIPALEEDLLRHPAMLAA